MDLYLAIFVATVLVIAGAWLGFWVVRKMVLTGEGAIDVSTSHYFEFAIRLLATVMILQNSLDPIMAGGALLLGTAFLSIMHRLFKLKYLHNLCRMGLSKGHYRNVREAYKPEDVFVKYAPTPQSLNKRSQNEYGIGTKELTGSPWSPPVTGSCSKPSKSDTFYSTFHSTPERKKYSKEEWSELARYSTKKALEELVSSPDFSKWAVANAERITLTPNKNDISNQKQRRSWFPWP